MPLPADGTNSANIPGDGVDMTARLQRELANFHFDDRSGLEKMSNAALRDVTKEGIYPQHFTVELTREAGRYKLSFAPSAQAKADGVENKAFQRVTAFVGKVSEANGGGLMQSFLDFPTRWFAKARLPRLPVKVNMSGLSDERSVEASHMGDLVAAVNRAVGADNRISSPASAMQR